MIKYIGSKRLLLPVITDLIASLDGVRTVADPFSGTSRVSHALKRLGYRVHASDHNAYAAALAACYIQANDTRRRDAEKLIAELNTVPPAPGYFTETFCERSRFFHPKNGERIDAIREHIETLALDPELRAIALVSLMEAADRVDSTTGVQMAYLKSWAARAHNDLALRVPDLLPQPAPGPCTAEQADAIDAVAKRDADLTYLDPPYNQHAYLGNYHAWESLVLWDKPDVYGIACKRTDCRERKSDFNSKRRFKDAMRSLLEAIQTRYVVISFNNEGYIDRPAMEALLTETFGPTASVAVLATDHKRYVGAQIGIYNLKGKSVGEVSHLRNVEYLYVVDRERALPPELTRCEPEQGDAGLFDAVQ
ncbi:MAG: DNA adenine methylase [Planctomycetota bacterium]